MESARCPQPKIPSPTSSAASKGEPKVSPVNEGTTNVRETVDDKTNQNTYSGNTLFNFSTPVYCKHFRIVLICRLF